MDALQTSPKPHECAPQALGWHRWRARAAQVASAASQDDSNDSDTSTVPLSEALALLAAVDAPSTESGDSGTGAEGGQYALDPSALDLARACDELQPLRTAVEAKTRAVASAWEQVRDIGAAFDSPPSTGPPPAEPVQEHRHLWGAWRAALSTALEKLGGVRQALREAAPNLRSSLEEHLEER